MNVSNISSLPRRFYDAAVQKHVRYGIGKDNPELAYKIMKINDYVTRPIKTRRAMKMGYYDSSEIGPSTTNAQWREDAANEVARAKEMMKEYPTSRFNEILYKNAGVNADKSLLQRQWGQYLDDVQYSPNSDLYDEIAYAEDGGMNAFLYPGPYDITHQPSMTIMLHK